MGRRAEPSIFVLDLERDAGLRRHSRRYGTPGLDAGLFSGRDHKFIVFEGLSFPLMLEEIQNQTRLDGELRVAWENPTPMLPRTNRIFMQPAPERRLAQLSDQTTVANMSGQ